EPERGRRSCLAGRGSRRLRADPEAVPAVAGRLAFGGGAVPAHVVADVRGEVLAVEAADDFADAVDDVDADVVLGLVAAQLVAEAGVAEAVVEGLARLRLGREEGDRAGARFRRGGAAAAAGRGR